jgi:hypothetical protein
MMGTHRISTAYHPEVAASTGETAQPSVPSPDTPAAQLHKRQSISDFFYASLPGLISGFRLNK